MDKSCEILPKEIMGKIICLTLIEQKVQTLVTTSMKNCGIIISLNCTRGPPAFIPEMS